MNLDASSRMVGIDEKFVSLIITAVDKDLILY